MMNTVISPARQALEKVRHHILTESLPERERIELLGSVDYFVKQLLCETERREADHVLRQRWRHFERRFVRARGRAPVPAQASLPREESLRQRLAVCVSLRQFFLPFDPNSKPAEVMPLLFRIFQERVRKAERMDAVEKSLCVLGLEYLEGESRRPRLGRDSQMIRKTWRRIYPLLKEAGILRNLRGCVLKKATRPMGEVDLKMNLLAFLTGVEE